jgi:hypothetical protein
MNWLKENPIPAAAAAVALVAMGALVYLAISAAERCNEAADAFNNEARQIDVLEKQAPFPNQSNLEALQKNLAEYEKALTDLQSGLASLNEPTKEISPHGFQDELRKTVDAIGNEAMKKNVALPKEFYLGFDEFRTRLPSKEEAVTLDREFQILKNVVSHLISLPVVSIDELTRLPMVRLGDPTAIQKNRFSLAFTANQETLVKAFNAIAQNNRFLLIRSAVFENSSPSAPAKKSTSPTDSEQPFSSEPEETTGKFQVVFGNESVTSKLQIEILTFLEVSSDTPTP